MSKRKGNSFEDLLDFIDEEAEAEGPEAVAQLGRIDEEFRLASQLISLRRGADLSQAKLAELSGIPQSEISRIETGAANPTYKTMTALARPLGAASVGWIVGSHEEATEIVATKAEAERVGRDGAVGASRAGRSTRAGARSSGVSRISAKASRSAKTSSSSPRGAKKSAAKTSGASAKRKKR